MLSKISSVLSSGSIRLVFNQIVDVEPGGELVPYYHFDVTRGRERVGHINLRMGDTRHIMMVAGHIGYQILPEYRGHAYSYFACLALKPFIRAHYDRVIITSDPLNIPSIRIIEKLGAHFLEEVKVHMDDPSYESGARIKRRYEWLVSLKKSTVKE